MTSDNPSQGGGHLAPGGSRVLLPGMPAELNADGVVSLVDATAGVFCSGGLIGDRYVLTSAHCVEAASIYTLDRVGFDTSTGLTSGAIAEVFIHPSYDGSLENGYELAVLRLVSDAPADAPRYGIYTANDELGRLSVKAGHGRTGHGSTGTTSFDAARRVGLNTYDATSTDFNNAFGMSMAPDAYVLYDFDSGLPDHNAWSQFGVASSLGFGADEVNAVSGDSGGPTFIHDGSDWLIGGVTAWGAGLPSDPPDVTPGITDGSWGEISADTRISSYADFVLAVLDGSYVRPQRYAYSQGNVEPDASWDRPKADGTTLSDVGPVQYHAYSYTVDTTGEYNLESMQNFDAVVHIYEGVPDPTRPLSGLIAGNDDGPDGPGSSALAGIKLTAGVTYTWVTSARTPGEIGTFLNAITGPGQVAAIPSEGGFAGAFAPTLWRFDTDHAEAHVQLDAAPGSVTIIAGDDASGGNTDYTTTITQKMATLSFDWTYFSLDDAGFDLFGVLVNGEFARLTDGVKLYGSHSLTLQAGDEFGFRVHTVDGVKGEGVANVYNLGIDLTGDFNHDGSLDAADVAILFSSWGSRPPGDPIADINRDGLVNALDRDAWVHDLKGIFYGDADMNGVYDSLDLINVFTAGEYHDADDGNSTWGTGDWDGDGDFTTSDLVLAFADGGYERGPRLAMNAVPEPSALPMFLAGLIGFAICRCR